MPPKPPTPICPKCGYDQSGEIATWSTQCPTQGTCNECGLQFDWLNIFNPHLTRLPWYTEHARSPWQLLRRTPSTLLRLVLPSIFWKPIKPTIIINIRTLVLWYLFLALTSHLAVSAVYAVSYYIRIRARAGWNWNRFINGGFYSYAELAFNSIFRGVFEMWTPVGASGLNTVSVQLSAATAFSNIYLRPIAISIGINLMWLIILLVIPTTRRIAKIRTAHVLRAFVLSMLATLLILQLSRYSIRTSSFYWYMHLELLGQSPSHQLIAIWQLFFWPAAIVHSWKIKPAKLLIILGTIAAVLTGLVLNLVVFITPDFI